MPTQDLETLKIKVSLDTSEVSKQSEKIKATLNSVAKASNNAIGGDNVKKQIKSVAPMIKQDLSNIKMPSFSGLDQLAYKTLPLIAQNLKFDTSLDNKLNIDNLTLQRLKDFSNEYKTLQDKLNKYTKLNLDTSDIKNKIKDVKKETTSMYEYLSKKGYNLNDIFSFDNKETSKETNKFKTSMVNLFKKIGGLAKFYLIKKTIVAIFQEITSSLENLKIVSPQTKKDLNVLKQSVVQIANGISTIIAPIVNILAPVVYKISTVLTTVFNKIGTIFQTFVGWTSGVQATTKSVEDLNSALEETQKATMSIDELNTLGDTSSTGDGFETITLDSEANAQLTKFIDSIEVLVEQLGEAISMLFDEDIKGLLNNLLEILTSINQALVPINELIMSVNTTLSPIFTLLEMISGLVATLSQGISTIFNLLLSPLSFIIELLSSVASFLMQIIKSVGELIVKGLESTSWFSKISEFFQNIIGWIDAIPQKLDGIIEKFRNFLGLGSDSDSGSGILGKIKSLFSGGYASGGFPDSGSLFVANESGAEMVGSVNGKTAVANNDQIVSAVSQGVYQAVLSAMSNQGSNDVNVVVQLDGKAIGQAVDNYNKNKGTSNSLFNGGLVNGY